MHLKQLCYAILVLMLNEITTEFCKLWRMRIYLDSHFIYIILIDWLINWCLTSSEQFFSYIQDDIFILQVFFSLVPVWTKTPIDITGVRYIQALFESGKFCVQWFTSNFSMRLHFRRLGLDKTAQDMPCLVFAHRLGNFISSG